MVRRTPRPRNQVRFDTKADLLAGGAEVRSARYQRASQDKKEQGKSVTDQGKLNKAEISRYSWTEADSFTDNDRSASRYATKERPDFERLIEGIQAGKFDVLVIWEISRKERDLAVYVKIRDMCTAIGLYFWLVGGVLYDLRDKNDRMMLGFQAVQAEWLADSIRDNVLRGIVGAAEAGRPHGRVAYGYRRIYHQRTRALERQELDTEIREATGRDGAVTKYSNAGIVEEIFDKVGSGTPLIVVERDLNNRGIPSPQGAQWRRGIIRKIAMNPAYIGKRVLRGEIVGEGIWPAIVDEETYWACVRLLEDPSRVTTKPARAVYLLSYIVTCGVCGGQVSCSRGQPKRRIGAYYRCLPRNCVRVKMEPLDELAERAVVAWLAQPEVFDLLSGGEDDETVSRARAEAERLKAELEEFKQLASIGEVKAVDYARISRGLEAQIAEQEKISAEAAIPPVLRGRIGPEAVAAWAALDGQVAVKRDIIRTVAQIKLLPPVDGDTTFGPRRVEWKWRFGSSDADVA
ncbi:recombinase family protein [Dactylosporangium sp. CA-092794]|uniref:recombinase family protein n=1 Tax=Dactylosporangium sp. CA-092794 TaxID=3239929 RepID=UPI003D92C0C4